MALHASISKLGLLILNSALAICSANDPPLPPRVLMKGKTFSLTYLSASSAFRFDQYDQPSFGSGKIGARFVRFKRMSRSRSCSASSRRLRKSKNESCSIASSGLENPPVQSLSHNASICERRLGSVSILY